MKSSAAGGTIEREGAAQGLAQVVACVHDTDNGQLLAQVAKSVARRRAQERRGGARGRRSTSCCSSGLVKPVLANFANDVELVRDAVKRAARAVVSAYAANSKALNVLLPTFEEALFSEAWRVRAGAAELLGELLINLAKSAAERVQLDQDELDKAAKEADKDDDNDNNNNSNGGAAESDLSGVSVGSDADERRARAGGAGLNLIGGSRLILLDSDWNPAMVRLNGLHAHTLSLHVDIHCYAACTVWASPRRKR